MRRSSDGRVLRGTKRRLTESELLLLTREERSAVVVEHRIEHFAEHATDAPHIQRRAVVFHEDDFGGSIVSAGYCVVLK